MINSGSLTRTPVVDLSQALLVVNSQATPFLSYLLATRTSKANDISVSRRVKTLSRTASGKSNEGESTFVAEKSSYATITNFCEIFEKLVTISETSAVIGSTLMSQEVLDRIEEVKYDIEYELINSLVSSSAEPRALKGLKGYARPYNVAQKVLGGTYVEGTSPVQTLTTAILDEAYAQLFQDGAIKDVVLLVNPFDKAVIDSIVLDKEKITIPLTPGVVTAGLSLSQFYTSLGFKVTIMPTMSVVRGNIFIVDCARLEVPVLRNLGAKDLAVVGDNSSKLIVTELTFIAPELQGAICLTNWK